MRESYSKSPPFISQQSVRQALDSLLFSSTPHTINPLTHLTLVDHILVDPAFPEVENPRQIAVQHLLIECITTELASLRNNLLLDGPATRETRPEAKVAIERDARQQFPELLGWSLLYYRYVRVDLNLTLQDYHIAANVDLRTMRRYQGHAIKRLTEIIAGREWRIRQDFRRLQLVGSIPGPHQEHLVGRDDLIHHIHDIIEHNPPAHIQLTGPRGIGKTALVRYVLRELIETDQVDRIVWIAQPTSVRYLQQQLYESLIQGQRLSVAEFTLIQRCVIVLDDANLLVDEDSTLLEEILKQPGNACVLVTNTFALPLGEAFKHIVVPELSKQAVEKILHLTRPDLNRYGYDPTYYARILWERVGGNPSAIKTAINNLSNIDLSEPLFGHDIDGFRRMFIQGYESLSEDAQKCFLAYMLLPANPFTLSEVEMLWPVLDVATQGSSLVSILGCGLVTKGPEDTYARPEAVERFLQWLYANNETVLMRMLALIDELEYSQSSLVAETIERALMSAWLNVDEVRALQWIMFACHQGIAQGRFARWVAIFENVDSLPPPLGVVYGGCLRHLADYDRAEVILHESVKALGTQGHFVEQGRGLIELAIVYRQKGLYERAFNVLERAKTIAETSKNANLLSRCNTEMAQIALDMNDAETVSELLQAVESSNIQTQILRIELLILLGQLDRAQHLAESSLRESVVASQGRIYVLLGRIMSLKGDFHKAQDWFDSGIMLLEQQDDVFALARAQSNRAALNLEYGEFLDEARELLEQAASTQRQLKDRAGLVFTLQNLRTLHRIDGERVSAKMRHMRP